ncbi:amine oxidase [Wallemia mellicola]|uniref:Amine oxidase n=1 Tax=Wallemia mellicola TaxID=1708541 RepID=A0A4T0S2G7_9BASI|nr:amine oxidase [Wallemia mellicola]TIB83573.1 amine oxidase [Wallemia mellicola]TIB95841.1 amine oxidase [Wallemia mellicola]TIC31207.1 amine oxidase [Wallemia mellicola]TIC37775.1 amine oxidase [Wallemia mellicola]
MGHPSDNIITDAIVIGSGFAGAILARKLAKQGRSVIVIESRERLGGRTNTIRLGDHDIDAGCSFIHGYSDSHPLATLSKELAVDVQIAGPKESTDVGSVIIGKRGPLDTGLQKQIQDALGKAVDTAKASNENRPLADVIDASLNETLQGETLAIAKEYVGSLDAPLGLPVNEIPDVSRFGWEKGLDGVDAVVTRGYSHLMSRIWEDALATDKVRIYYDHGVVSLSTKDKVKSIISTHRGQFEAKVVVCTVPLATLQNPKTAIEFHPELSKEKQEAIKSTPVGLLEKLIYTYDDYWWRSSYKTGGFAILPTKKSFTSAKEILESHVLNVQTFPNHPSLLIFLPAGAIRLLKCYSRQEVEEAGAEVLAERLGGVKARKAYSTSWLKEQDTNGATSTYASPEHLKALQQATDDDRLGFAGEHTEIDNHGSVNGAVLSGLREAERVERYLEKRASEPWTGH